MQVGRGSDLDRSGIYRISNTISGRFYIGSAKTFRERWANHKCSLAKGHHENTHLQRAWSKYGPDAFKFYILELVDDPLHLIEAEQRHIDAHWSTGMLYNVCPTAGNSLGTRHSLESRRKIAAARIGKEPWNRGVTHSAEARRKISERTAGRTPWNKGKRGLQAGWNKGKKLGPQSAELREKLSRLRRGKKRHPSVGLETAARQSALWVVTFPDGHSEEVRNINQFSRERGLSSSAFSARGRTKGYTAVKVQDGDRRIYRRGYTLDKRPNGEDIPRPSQALSGMGGSLTLPQ